jgi:hypothetical protein
MLTQERVAELLSLPLEKATDSPESIESIDLQDLIDVAHTELTLMLEGKVFYKKMPVKPYMLVYGSQGSSSCFACLGGGVLLRATGVLYHYHSQTELKRYRQGLVFLNGLRIFSLKSRSWRLLQMKGFNLPQRIGAQVEGKDSSIEEFTALDAFKRQGPAKVDMGNGSLVKAVLQEFLAINP